VVAPEVLDWIRDRWVRQDLAYFGGRLGAVPAIRFEAPPGRATWCGSFCPVPGPGVVCLSPELMTGDHQLLRAGTGSVHGRLSLLADVCIHEQVHCLQLRVRGVREEAHDQHGPAFLEACREVGAQMGGLRKSWVGRLGLHNVHFFPMCVRKRYWYAGAYRY
jgi:hypothetical protein